jgi:protein phosphatase
MERPDHPAPASLDGEADGALPTAAALRRRVESHGLSHAGRVRARNEDHFVIASVQRSVQVRQTNLADRTAIERLCGPMAYLFAVADGVGGGPAGEVASRMAVETTVEYLGETVGCWHALAPGQEQQLLDPLSRAVERAHERLLRTFRAAQQPVHQHGYGGTQGTGPATLVVWPRAYLVHVGDSRAYLWRAGRLSRVTRDQTMGAYLVEQRALSEQQAERSGLNNVLASALGTADMTPAIHEVDLVPGDQLLLCTDGLTGELPEDEIAAVLASGGHVEARCRTLVERTLAAGARDNVTVVVVELLAD